MPQSNSSALFGASVIVGSCLFLMWHLQTSIDIEEVRNKRVQEEIKELKMLINKRDDAIRLRLHLLSHSEVQRLQELVQKQHKRQHKWENQKQQRQQQQLLEFG